MRNLNQQMDIDASVVLTSEEIIDVVLLCNLRDAVASERRRRELEEGHVDSGLCCPVGVRILVLYGAHSGNVGMHYRMEQMRMRVAF